VASRGKPVVDPDDAKGMKIRGGSREMDLMLKAAGAAVVTLPSNEIYAAMQTGAMEAALTSSTSLISFRLEEVSKALTTGRRPYWFMFEPLMMSKAVFDRLPKDQQATSWPSAPRWKPSRSNAAKADDQQVANVYKGRRQGGRPEPGRAEKMAGHRPHHRMEGLRRTQRSCANLLKLAEKTL
jgi:TRAP-type C4-dicarboxylate transport system substrate-binding protein